MVRRSAKHGRKQTFVGSIAVLLVVAMVGFLLITNMRVNRTTSVTSDAAELVEQRVHHISTLQQQVNKLSQQVDDYNTLLTDGEQQQVKQMEEAGSSTMLPAVEGPGLTVTLNDSAMWENKVDSSGSTTDIDKYVVHQQDVEAVVDALWAGGAESMQIMGQRVLPNSAVICSGNVLMLQGQKYSPPFTISAIGPTNTMLTALNNSQAIQIYKEYVDAFGLGYKVKREEKLFFEKTPAFLQPIRYARAIDEPKDKQGTADTSQQGKDQNQP